MRGNDFVEPLGMRVLIRKDESRNQTRGGIVLPDQAEIPTITGRVVEVSLQIERDADFPIEKYDKVLFHPLANEKHSLCVFGHWRMDKQNLSHAAIGQ